jgi:ATPase family associated with various cellular activities (AAA)
MNILNNNGKYHFFNALKIEQILQPKTYLFNFDENGNCWLEDVEDFKFPAKIYDVNDELRKYIKISYTANKKNLGVLLTGNKGQGKSLTAKLICKELNQPTILINKQIPAGVNFVKFLNEIKQDHTLFVDEFEKLFDTHKDNNETNGYHTQETFLSFMDGVLTNEHKVLFLLTTNDTVNEFFINRPSRIKFLQEYNELPEELFNLITDDRLNNLDFKEDLEENISLVNLNIDLLISIIDDINLFDKPFSEFKDMYNYKFEQYKYEVYRSDKGGETWDSMFNSSRKIKYSDRYISNYTVNEMVKFKSDEIIFKTNIYEEVKGKNVKKEITIKMVPFRSVGISKFAF